MSPNHLDDSPINRAGFPATIVYGATSLVTTEQAPTIAPWPTVTPLKIEDPKPIQASFSITIELVATSAKFLGCPELNIF